MRVSEVMASDVTVVAPSATIDAAAQIMADLDIDTLPVGETEAALAGIITSRDILLRVVAPRRDPRTTRVAEAMSPKSSAAPRRMTRKTCCARWSGTRCDACPSSAAMAASSGSSRAKRWRGPNRA
jgi:CBS domain-containing protein